MVIPLAEGSGGNCGDEAGLDNEADGDGCEVKGVGVAGEIPAVCGTGCWLSGVEEEMGVA